MADMKLSFNTWVYSSFPVWVPAYPLEETIKRIARIGYDGIEIESISNWGLCGLLLNFRFLFVLHSRIPANEGLPELVIEHLRPDLQ